MTLDEFRGALVGEAPPEGLELALQGLWWAAKGNWHQAHECVQACEGRRACDWVHGYLHRVEGDAANAGYWYQRAGQDMAHGALGAEWEKIAAALLAA